MRTRRPVIVFATVLALFVATVATAFAYFTNSGQATGSATTGTLNPPTGVSGVQTPGTGTVSVSWTASTGTTPAPAGYYVVRNDGTSDSAACNTSPASLITSTSCNDLLVPIGSFTYRVVAVNHTWTATSGASSSVPVVQSSQSITFTSSPVSPVYGGTYTVTATGGTSGNPVTFSSATPGVCSVAGSLVSFVGVGTCTINADQIGNTYYSAAPTKQQSFGVAKADQTITFPTVAPGTVFSTGTLGATASSGLTVTYNTTTGSVCSISGTTINYLTSGTCTINAHQAGNANYNAAANVQQNISVGKASQTITVFNAPSSGTFGGTGSLSGTASSGLTVTFSSNTSNVCTVSGSTVTYVGTGTCIVQADQAGDSNHYTAAAPSTKSFSVIAASQTISWPTAPSSGQVGIGASLSATASSGLTVTFTSTTPSVCTVSGTSVTYLTPGTCIINADQAGNSNYNAAPTVTDSFTVTKQSQTITFGTLANKTFPVTAFTVSATASSGLTVAFSSATPSVCTVSGTTVTVLTAGGCTINADQAGNGTFAAATTVQRSFTIAKGTQTVSFGTTNPTPVAFGATYTPTATATSTLTVTISIDATTTSVCSISGGVVTFNAIGTCKVDANQAGDTNWNAATQVQQSIVVNKANQTIGFTSTNPTPVTAGDPTYTPAATATSGLAVVITLDATSTGCTLSGGVVSFPASGTCRIDANQAGNTNYNAAPQAQQVITINPASQTITFGTPNPSPVQVGGGTYTPTATASSGLTVTITLDATSVGCTLTGGVVSFVGVGTCKVDANQAGNGTYSAAPQVQQSIVINKGDQTITFSTTNPTPRGGGAQYTPGATATSGLNVAFAVSGACSISAGVVTFAQTGGSCTITASQAGNANWNAATSVNQVVTVNVGPTITSVSTISKGGSPASVTITGTGFVSGTGFAVTAGGSFTASNSHFVSSTSATVTLTYGSGNRSGTVTVTNPDGGTVTANVSAV